jgi:pyruvate/2-oxoglutarate dehydrogenase complex dihydrolipoamide acyltransferase (E2) component
MTDTVTEDTATKEAEKQAAKEKAAADKAAAKEAKAKERAEAKEKAAKEREEAKARKQAEQAEAKAKAAQEKIEAAAKDGEIDLSTVKGTGDDGAVTLKDVREAIKTKRAEERANRPKKAALTLSQRRAVLKLAETPLRPTTDMNRTPLEYLKSVGLADSRDVEASVSKTVKVDNPKAGEEGEPAKIDQTTEELVTVQEYFLTEQGATRAGEINPKWKTWKPAA